MTNKVYQAYYNKFTYMKTETLFAISSILKCVNSKTQTKTFQIVSLWSSKDFILVTCWSTHQQKLKNWIAAGDNYSKLIRKNSSWANKCCFGQSQIWKYWI